MTNTQDRGNSTRPTVPVFFAVDDNYAPFLAVALRSLIDNASPAYDYRIHILITSLSEENLRILTDMEASNVHIEAVDVNERLQAFGDKLHLRDYYTKTTYYRFFIPELFPEYDRALYLDCDIAVLGDISELYNAPIGKHMLGAVVDDMIRDFEVFGTYAQAVVGVPCDRYFNAGILVMNLKKMRETGLNAAFLSMLNTRTFCVAQDQDYLNALCLGDVAYLDQCWNVNARETLTLEGEARIVHYKINWKPWHYKGIRFEEAFWHYADQTPYASMLTRMRDTYSTEQKSRDAAQYHALVELARKETEAACAAVRA